jgi:hypothetical protein
MSGGRRSSGNLKSGYGSRHRLLLPETTNRGRMLRPSSIACSDLLGVRERATRALNDYVIITRFPLSSPAVVNRFKRQNKQPRAGCDTPATHSIALYSKNILADFSRGRAILRAIPSAITRRQRNGGISPGSRIHATEKRKGVRCELTRTCPDRYCSSRT